MSCKGTMRYWFWPACVTVVSILCRGQIKSTRTTYVDIILRALFDGVCVIELVLRVLWILNPACPALWAFNSALKHHKMPCRSHWSRWWIYSSLLVFPLCIFWAFYTDIVSRHNFPWVRLTSCSRDGYDFSRRFDPDLRFCLVSETQRLTVAS